MHLPYCEQKLRTWQKVVLLACTELKNTSNYQFTLQNLDFTVVELDVKAEAGDYALVLWELQIV